MIPTVKSCMKMAVISFKIPLVITIETMIMNKLTIYLN